MCGRFTLTVLDFEELARSLGARYEPGAAEAYRPRYNVAPTSEHWVVAASAGHRTIAPARWAFGPRALPLLRSESASRQFPDAFAEGRCAVPVDGFFEWSGARGARVPHWFHRADRGVMLLAAIASRDARGLGFALLSTRANATVAVVHDRMPVVVAPGNLDRWLRGSTSEAGGLLAPAPDALLVDTVVDARVNSARHDDPACLTPASHAQGALFPERGPWAPPDRRRA